MSQDSMTSDWYYSKAGSSPGSEVGPLSWEDLYLLARAGTVEPGDTLWHPRLPRGMAAGALPELFPELQASPAPLAEEFQTESHAEPQLDEPQPELETIAPQPAEALEEAAADEMGAGPAPEEEREEQAYKPRAVRRGNTLPILVVLLVLVIAAAGVTAYFLYFR